eukprot:m.118363 g.118363  ORF g.118363 m.118363 type:complete len:108 (+) comp15447_c0_seq2:1451-1774(+)
MNTLLTARFRARMLHTLAARSDLALKQYTTWSAEENLALALLPHAFHIWICARCNSALVYIGNINIENKSKPGESSQMMYGLESWDEQKLLFQSTYPLTDWVTSWVH